MVNASTRKEVIDVNADPEWHWIPAQGFASTIDEEVVGLMSMPRIRFNKNYKLVIFRS